MSERVALSDLFGALWPEGMIPSVGDTGIDHDPAKGFPLANLISAMKYTGPYLTIGEELRALPPFDARRHRLRRHLAKIVQQARADGISLPPIDNLLIDQSIPIDKQAESK